MKDHISDELRRVAMEESGGTCYYCGWPATQVDHVVPEEHSGATEIDNLVASCARCNMIAGAKVFDTLRDKRLYVRSRLEKKKRRSQNTFTFCVDCQVVFRACWNGATSFLCSRCAGWDRDGVEPDTCCVCGRPVLIKANEFCSKACKLTASVLTKDTVRETLSIVVDAAIRKALLD